MSGSNLKEKLQVFTLAGGIALSGGVGDALATNEGCQGDRPDPSCNQPTKPPVNIDNSAAALAAAEAQAAAEALALAQQAQQQNQELTAEQQQILDNHNALTSEQSTVVTPTTTSAATSNSGGNKMTSNYNSSYKSGAITGAPTMGGLSVPDACMDGLTFTVGGGTPYGGSGGIGFSFINPAGVALENGYLLQDVLDATAGEERMKTMKGLSDTDIEKVTCILAAWQQERERQKFIFAAQAQEHNFESGSELEKAMGHAFVGKVHAEYGESTSDVLDAHDKLTDKNNFTMAELLNQMNKDAKAALEAQKPQQELTAE